MHELVPNKKCHTHALKINPKKLPSLFFGWLAGYSVFSVPARVETAPSQPSQSRLPASSPVLTHHPPSYPSEHSLPPTSPSLLYTSSFFRNYKKKDDMTLVTRSAVRLSRRGGQALRTAKTNAAFFTTAANQAQNLLPKARAESSRMTMASTPGE